MKRVLVTGGTGFIGAYVVTSLLSSGYEVCVIGRTRPKQSNVVFESADLLDPDVRRQAVTRQKATHLLHLAWIADPGVYWRSPKNLDWAGATFDLLKAFHEAGGERAVMAGTCAEYEWGGERLQEEITPCRPSTLYGTAKDATRRLTMAYARECGFSAAWARLFFLYGPGEKSGRLVSDALVALRDAKPFPTSHGLQKRDFLHVADVAGALVALLGTSVSGAVNIGSGKAVAVRDILDALAERIGNRDCLLYGRRSLPTGEPPVIEADAGRLFSEVGFRPVFDLASGLTDAVVKFARHGDDA